MSTTNSGSAGDNSLGYPDSWDFESYFRSIQDDPNIDLMRTLTGVVALSLLDSFQELVVMKDLEPRKICDVLCKQMTQITATESSLQARSHPVLVIKSETVSDIESEVDEVADLPGEGLAIGGSEGNVEGQIVASQDEPESSDDAIESEIPSKSSRKKRRAKVVRFQFECPSCRKTFTRYRNMIRHSSHVHGKKKFICDQCGSSYSRLDTLNEHVESSHSQGGGRFICPNRCGARQKSRQALNAHLKVCSRFKSKGRR